MSRIWKLVATLAVVATLAIITAGSALAAPGTGKGSGGGTGGGNGNNPPSTAATPELESIALFATGAAGMAGYALTRIRARKR